MSARRDALRLAAEAARDEVVRRLRVKGLPTSERVQQLRLVDNEDWTGWTSEWQDVQRSSLASLVVADAVEDSSVEHRRLGLRDQLEPLAELLARTTCLGELNPNPFVAAKPGVDNALVSFVLPLVMHYLTTLSDLDVPEPALIDGYADDLDALVERGVVLERSQIALDGVRVTQPMDPRRGVYLRPLDPFERGAYVEKRGLREPSGLQGEFIVPSNFGHFAPRALLEYVQPQQQPEMSTHLDNRLLLAFYLRGHDVSSSGVRVTVAEPRWATFGTLGSPLPVESRPTALPSPIDQNEFEAVVDLAFAAPPFGDAETTREEVALFRVLRGCGARHSSLLDFAIALEAALLGDTNAELAYRFRLYGALYLRTERDPADTWAQLKDIYSVRSNLVHGSPVTSAKRRAAEVLAKDLATAVIKRAIEAGWPKTRELDLMAIESCHDGPRKDS